MSGGGALAGKATTGHPIFDAYGIRIVAAGSRTIVEYDSGAGINANAASTSAAIETQNNAVCFIAGACLVAGKPIATAEANKRWTAFFQTADGHRAVEAYGSEALVRQCAGNGASTACQVGEQRLTLMRAAPQPLVADAGPSGVGTAAVVDPDVLTGTQARIDSAQGPGAYNRIIAAGDAEQRATDARVTAAQTQFDKQIGCIVPCSAAAAATPIIATWAGGYAAVTYGLSSTGQIATTAITGAGLNAATTFGQNALFGQTTTAGQLIGSGITGAFFVPGLTIVRSPVINGAITQGGGALLGDLIGQNVDNIVGAPRPYNYGQTATATVIGAGAGAAASRVADGYLAAPTIGSTTTTGQILDGLHIQVNELPRSIAGAYIQTSVNGVIDFAGCARDASQCQGVFAPLATTPQPTTPGRKGK